MSRLRIWAHDTSDLALHFDDQYGGRINIAITFERCDFSTLDASVSLQKVQTDFDAEMHTFILSRTSSPEMSGRCLVRIKYKAKMLSNRPHWRLVPVLSAIAVHVLKDVHRNLNFLTAQICEGYPLWRHTEHPIRAYDQGVRKSRHSFYYQDSNEN